MDASSSTEIFLLIINESEENMAQGEGRVDKYADRIPVNSFSFSMKSKQSSVTQSDESSIGNVDMGTVSVTRPFDAASKAISQLIKGGEGGATKFAEARLTVDQHMTWGQSEEREQNAIIVFHLYNGYIAEQKLNAKEAGKGGASIDETIELAYKNVQIDYYILNRKSADSAERSYRAKATTFATEFEDDHV